MCKVEERKRSEAGGSGGERTEGLKAGRKSEVREKGREEEDKATQDVAEEKELRCEDRQGRNGKKWR